MDTDIMIGQIVLDEEKMIREHGGEYLAAKWAYLDERFNEVGAKRVKHNFYIKSDTLSILSMMLFLLKKQPWFAENIRTLYWYNPANDGEEDVMTLSPGKLKRSLDEWDPACVAELASMV